VTLHKDGRTITVSDDGRGIPVDLMPKYKESALEVILTTLHAGGKFEQGNYIHSGGLHGVGSSVVTALSTELVATVKTGGKRYEQTYARGKATSKLKTLGPCRGSGTTMRFTPDPEIFGEKLRFDPALIRDRLEAKSYLHKGLTILFADETVEPAERHTLQARRRHRRVPAEGGGRARPPHRPARGGALLLRPRTTACAWRRPWSGPRPTDEHVRSYVNGIPHPQRRHARERPARGHRQGGAQLHRDPRPDPQGRLAHRRGHPRGRHRHPLGLRSSSRSSRARPRAACNNPEVASLVDNVVRPALENWLNDKPEPGRVGGGAHHPRPPAPARPAAPPRRR
jgi:DNA gyrase subunit B/topoisomerase-4 subunit B